jgi:hypothetical protein
MNEIAQQLKLGKQVVELLDAAECLEISTLAGQSAEEFHSKLTAINSERKIHKIMPSLAQVSEWISKANQQLASSPQTEEIPAGPTYVNFEYDPEIVEMISMSPLALPLPGKLLAEKGVPVLDIPIAVLLTNAPGDVSLRVGTKAPAKSESKTMMQIPSSTGGNVNSITFGTVKEEISVGRFRTTEDLVHPSKRAAPVVDAPINPRHQLMRSTLPETNEGVSPHSRRYVRGVLHTNRGQVLWGAIFTIACQLIIPIGIMAALMLLMKDQQQAMFQWVPGWFIVLPFLVFVFGLLYFLVSFHASCRVCGQKCFVPRECLKNKKAHHLPVLGYILPTALHMLVFRWFRCAHCGTPIRLKE